MQALGKLTAVEARLVLRDHALVFFVFAFPLLLLTGFSLIPGFGEPNPGLGGQSGTEFIASIGIAMIIGLVGFSVLPTFLAGYREKGILRRLHATPVSPALLLVAQLAVGAGAALASVALVLSLGRAAFGVPLPARFGWFALVVLLGTAALLALGLVIAALAPSGRAASVIGAIVFQPSLFLAGVWVPREALPAALRRVGDLTPLGAALQAVRDTWTGLAPRPLHLGILAAYALVAGVAAARLFRWD